MDYDNRHIHMFPLELVELFKLSRSWAQNQGHMKDKCMSELLQWAERFM